MMVEDQKHMAMHRTLGTHKCENIGGKTYQPSPPLAS
jgi:hypothetical protein